LPACGAAGPAAVPSQVGPSVVAPSNSFLRSAFDTDPSMYLGRFVPSEAAAVDESSAMQLVCSEHVAYREVGGGGVVYDELFNASSDAALRIGVPQVGLGVQASGSSHTTVRIRYELTRKLVAEIEDVRAFESCCKTAPDQCTDRYLGEF